MYESEHTVIIRRPIEDVFDFVSDLSKEQLWQPDIVELAWTSQGQPRAGSTFREVRRVMGRQFEIECVVTGFAPPTHFCIRTTSKTPSFTSCRLLEAVDGGTRTTQDLDLHLTGIYKLLGWYAERAATKQLVKELITLKAILEAWKPRSLSAGEPARIWDCGATKG